MVANKLTLNFDKTNFMKFATNSKTCNLNIGYDRQLKLEQLNSMDYKLMIT
jgi:hypothetical protein